MKIPIVLSLTFLASTGTAELVVVSILFILGAVLCVAYLIAPFMLYAINDKLGRIEWYLAQMNQRSAAAAQIEIQPVVRAQQPKAVAASAV